MKKTTLVGFVAVLSISAIGAASMVVANDGMGGKRGMGPRGPQFSFEELDVNADGKITPEEMAEHRAMKFAESDTDNDGLLSKEELVASALERAKEGMGKGIERMIEHRDTDGDGKISQAELSGDKDRSGKFFEHMDKDGDGAISQDEMASMKDRRGHGKKRWGHGDRPQKHNE